MDDDYAISKGRKGGKRKERTGFVDNGEGRKKHVKSKPTFLLLLNVHSFEFTLFTAGGGLVRQSPIDSVERRRGLRGVENVGTLRN